MNTEKLAADAHALAVLFGSRLLKAQELCDNGADFNGDELSKIASEINSLNGMLNALYYTAKLTLPEDDFAQFVYR